MTRETTKSLCLIGVWSAIGLLVLSLIEFIFHGRVVEPEYLATFAVVLFIVSIIGTALSRTSAEKQEEHRQQSQRIPRVVALSQVVLWIVVGIGLVMGLAPVTGLKWALGALNVLITVVAVRWWFQRGGIPDGKVIWGPVSAAVGWTILFRTL